MPAARQVHKSLTFIVDRPDTLRDHSLTLSNRVTTTMQRHDTQHIAARCPVYLHPAAASNPRTVDRIQRATGQLVVIIGHRTQLRDTTPPDFGPFGGAA